MNIRVALILLIIFASVSAKRPRKHRRQAGKYRIRNKWNKKLFKRVDLYNQPYLRGPSSPKTRVPPPTNLAVGLNSGGAPGSRRQTDEPGGLQVEKVKPHYEKVFGDGTAPRRQVLAGIEASTRGVAPDPKVKNDKTTRSGKLPKKKIDRERLAYVSFFSLKVEAGLKNCFNIK